MRLYRVEVEYELYVVAEDEEDAERQASHEIQGGCNTDPDHIYASPVSDISGVPPDWRLSIPFGPMDLVGDRTIEQFLAKEGGNQLGGATPPKEDK